MREISGNLFDYPVICIPTNGIVKNDKRLVMGAGVAYEASKKFKDLDLVLGSYVSKYGNQVHVIDYKFDKIIFSFPTKHHYKENSDINLIETSTKQLIDKVNKLELKEVYLPKVGCGKGNLNWSSIKPILEDYLDDKFIVVDYVLKKKRRNINVDANLRSIYACINTNKDKLDIESIVNRLITRELVTQDNLTDEQLFNSTYELVVEYMNEDIEAS